MEATTSKPRRDRSWDLVGELGRFGVPLFLLALVVTFSLLRPESFATLDNYRAILDQQTVIVLLALGVMMPLLVGELDLSNATVLATANVAVLSFTSKEGMPFSVAIVATIVLAIVVGLANGLVIVKLRVPAFVATLAMATLLYGAQLWYTNSEPVIAPQPESFIELGRGRVFGIPLSAIYVVVIAGLIWVVLTSLPVGRRLHAIGGNRRAALLSGIPTDRYIIGAFVASALLAGVAGILLGAQVGTAQPSLGFDQLFPAITAAFLGATTIRPGRFNVLGTITSVYVLAVAISGLQQLGAEVWVQPMFNGLTLVLAVALSGWAFTRKAARARAAQLRQLAQEALVETDTGRSMRKGDTHAVGG